MSDDSVIARVQTDIAIVHRDISYVRINVLDVCSIIRHVAYLIRYVGTLIRDVGTDRGDEPGEHPTSTSPATLFALVRGLHGAQQGELLRARGLCHPAGHRLGDLVRV